MCTFLSGIKDNLYSSCNQMSETPCCQGFGKFLEGAKKVLKVVATILLCVVFAIFNPIIFGVSFVAGLAFHKTTMETLDNIKALFFKNVLTVVLGSLAAIVLLPATLILGTVLSGAYVGAFLYDYIPSKAPSPQIASLDQVVVNEAT